MGEKFAAIFRWIVALIFGGIILFVVIGVLLPNHFTVQRSMTLSHTAAAVFPQIDRLEAFRLWAPWLRHDSNVKIQFSGPSEGVGSTMNWTSTHPDVREGKIEIIESIPTRFVRYEMNFVGLSVAESSFELIQNGPKSTEIIWIYDMALDSIFMRYLALGMGDIIGESCEQGLRYLGEIMDNLS